MRRRRRRSDREGEAAFYLAVAVIAIFSLVFYWKVFLLIAAIAAVLFLILYLNKSPILIQCKNWSAAGKYLITHANIKEFIGNAAVFLEKQPLYADRPVRRLFVTSENVLDQSAIKYIRNNTGIVEHRVIPMP